MKKIDEETRLICNDYKKLSIKDLAKKYKKSTKKISNILKSNNVKIKNRRIVNNNVFKDYKTNPNSQYWIWFLIGDGGLNYKRSSISLEIQIKDKEHLEKYKNYVEPKLNILYTKGKNSCRVLFINKEVFNFFISLNITPKKSLTINPIIPLTPAGIRGILDADGCIYSRGHDVSFRTFSPYLYSIIRTFSIKHGWTTEQNNLNVSNGIVRFSSLSAVCDFYKTVYSEPNCTHLERKKDSFWKNEAFKLKMFTDYNVFSRKEVDLLITKSYNKAKDMI